jgi:glycerophosphoryl diester phosphodiesterase
MRLSVPTLATSRAPSPPAALAAPVLNIAHRGASAAAPENTLAAVRSAHALGAHMVEVDVQRSRDGELVLMHDTSLVRTTDARRVLPGRSGLRVGDLTLDELRRLDAGGWRGAAFAGEGVPTLGETLGAVHELGLGLQLELKTPELYPGVVGDVAAALGSGPGAALLRTGRLVVQSFDFAAMKELKTLRPALPVGLLGTPPLSHLPVLAGWADQVNPRHVTVDRAYVDRVHALGMRCLVWTVDRSVMVRRALRMGVDGVISNRPDLVARQLAAVRLR